MTTPAPNASLPRDLGDGLMLRRATPADIAPLEAWSAAVFHPTAGAHQRYIMEGHTPHGAVDDFTIVEDTASQQIVSSLGLLRRTWTYDAIPFAVGQPEFVLTQPAYQRRGLVRTQMDVVHAWSAARGDLVQVIGGIPHYYRQFGYALALEYGVGRVYYTVDVPPLPADATEPYQVRPATADDVPFLVALYARAQARYLVATQLDAADWASMVRRNTHDATAGRNTYHIITQAGGIPAGYLVHNSEPWLGKQLGVFSYEIAPAASWFAVTPSVLRYLADFGRRTAQPDATQFGSLSFALGRDHPVYPVLGGRARAGLDSGAWYIRIPDLPRFLLHIAPALDRRLAQSSFAAYTGTLKLSFYRAGLHLTFADGHLTAAEPWRPTDAHGTLLLGHPDDGNDAAFPDLTFTELLLGYRSLAELTFAHADCRVRGELAPALLDVLFPKRTSHLAFG